jgi:hypothetical protein
VGPGMQLQAKDAGPLQNLLNRRNQSFLAHGTSPARKEDVEQLLEIYEKILNDLLGAIRMAERQSASCYVRL